MNQIPLDQMAPLAHPVADLFLLGFVAACSLVAGLFFLRFWRDTRDMLFLGFAVFFFIEAASEIVVVTLSHPNAGTPGLFILRLAATLAVLAAILWKNTASR